MGPDELTMRAVAQRMGLQDSQAWRVLPQGRADILFLVAADLQMRRRRWQSTTGCANGRPAGASSRIWMLAFATRTGMHTVACSRCERRKRYRLDTLIARYGADAGARAIVHELTAHSRQ